MSVSTRSLLTERSISRATTVLRALEWRWFVHACLACAFALRLCWIIAIPTQPVSDGTWYFQQGLRLAAGEGYSVSDDSNPLGRPTRHLRAARPTAFWPIGYPAFLAAVFSVTPASVSRLFVAKLANAVLYLAVMLSVAYCATVVSGSPIAGRVSLAVLAVLPNHVAYTALVMSEIWFTALMCGSIALLVTASRERRILPLAGAGVLLGLAVLTKPQIVLLPAVVWLSFRGAPGFRWQPLAALYLVLLLVVLPWSVRNYRVFGRFVFVSTNSGANLLIAQTRGPSGSGGYTWNPLLKRIAASEPDEIRRDTLARQHALAEITAHPKSIVTSVPAKLVALYAFDVDGFGWSRLATAAGPPPWIWLPLRIAANTCYWCILAAACIAVWRRRRAFPPYFRAGLAVMLYFSMLSAVFFGISRFHFPVVPWLVMYASLWISDAIAGRNVRTSAPAVSVPA